jgi:hypothetical protein
VHQNYHHDYFTTRDEEVLNITARLSKIHDIKLSADEEEITEGFGLSKLI